MASSAAFALSTGAIFLQKSGRSARKACAGYAQRTRQVTPRWSVVVTWWRTKKNRPWFGAFNAKVLYRVRGEDGCHPRPGIGS